MSQTGDIKILIIEDEALVARELELRLIKLGYKVVGVAASGAAAFTLAEEHKPDLLLTDIHIKGTEDGIGVAHRIRAEREVPVVFLTAFSDSATVARAKEVEPYGYIIKPIESRELEVAIEIALYKFRMEKELKETRELLSMALQCVGNALLFVDESGLVCNMNSEMLGLLKSNLDDENGRYWYESLGFNKDIAVRKLIDDSIKSASLTRLSPFVFQNKSHEKFLVDGVVGPREEGHVLILRCITEIQDEIEKLVGHLGAAGDPAARLLPGEVSFVQLMIGPDQTAYRQLSPVLKDQLLDEIEKCVNQTLRSTDLASRYGESLLVASLPYTSLADGERIARSLLRELESRKYCSGELNCRFSMGLSHGGQGDDDPFELLRRAALAFDRAREAGGGGIVTWESGSGQDLEVLRPGDDRVKSYQHILLLWNVMNTLGKEGESTDLIKDVLSHIRRSLGIRSVVVLEVENGETSVYGHSSISRDSGNEEDSTASNWRHLVGETIAASVEKLIFPVHEEQLHSQNYSLFKFHNDRRLNVVVFSGTEILESSDFNFIENLVDYLSTAFGNLLERDLDDFASPGGWNTDNLIFQSSAMKSVVEKISMVAPTDATVLINGESGTGKELVAALIHDMSERKDKPFVIVDCGAVVDTLIESELFGHVRGAFTGAVTDSIGRLREAEGGTVLLDEIGELPMEVQSRLLRFVQDKQVMSVGGQEYDQVNTRVLAATNRNLKELIKAGKFREDLYYRLNVFFLELPPLRERPSDIPALASYYLKLYAEQYGKTINGFTEDALNGLVKYAWPGNVRELINLINRSVILCRDTQISSIHLGLFESDSVAGTKIDEVLSSENPRSKFRSKIASSISECMAANKFPPIGLWLEDDIILAMVERQGGISSRAASALNLPETTLRRKMMKIQAESVTAEKPGYWSSMSALLPGYIEYAEARNLSVIEDCRRIVIEETIRQTSNRSKAANLVGVSQPTYRKILADMQNSP